MSQTPPVAVIIMFVVVVVVVFQIVVCNSHILYTHALYTRARVCDTHARTSARVETSVSSSGI